MRYFIVLCIVGALAAASVYVVSAADVVKTGAAGDWPQLSAAARKVLSNYRGGAETVVWPGTDEKVLPPDQIPEKIREGDAQWLARVLKEDYLDTDLPKKMFGVRRANGPPGRDVDCTFIRYKESGSVIQACEHTAGMTVLISPAAPSPKGPEDWQGAMCLATQVFSKVFREPALPMKYVSVTTMWSEKDGKDRIFYGRLSLNVNKEFDAKAPRYWYDDVTFLVEGDRVAFLFFKTDGEVEGEGASPRPPSGKRW